MTRLAVASAPAVATALPSEVATTPPASEAATTLQSEVAVASEAGLHSPCAKHLATARVELLKRGFAPTRDTARWLRVTEAAGAAELSLVMRSSADGASTWFRATFRAHVSKPSAWRRVRRRYCCDEHATEDDDLQELNWKRDAARGRAELSIVDFGKHEDPTGLRNRALFEELAKAALDRCLF